MNRVVNCINLLHILGNGQIYSKEYLASILQTSPRNLISYRKDLSDAGYVIESIPSRYGGYKLESKHRLPNYILTKEDFKTLDHLLTYLEQTNFTFKNEALILLSKINTSSTSFDRSISYMQLLDSASNNIIKEKIVNINEAIEHSFLISFEYMNYKRQKSSRVVEPYAIINYHKYWYLIALDTLDKNYKFFKISHTRMTSLIVTTQKFAKDSTFNIDHYLKNEHFFSFKKQEVVCYLSNENALLVEEAPIGNVVKSYWHDDRLYYHTTFDSTQQAMSFVFSQMNNIDLIGPPSLIEEVKRMSDELVKQYV